MMLTLPRTLLHVKIHIFILNCLFFGFIFIIIFISCTHTFVICNQKCALVVWTDVKAFSAVNDTHDSR